MAAGDKLLDALGNVILEADGDVQLSDGAGDDCCCGGEIGNPCTHCTGDTPATVRVTLDFAAATLCACFSNGDGTFTEAIAKPTGTFDVPQLGLNPCVWTFLFSYGSALVYRTSSCGTPGTALDHLKITVTKTAATTYSVCVWATTGTETTIANLFAATATVGADCLTEFTPSNTTTCGVGPATCNAAFRAAMTGGSVTVNPL